MFVRTKNVSKEQKNFWPNTKTFGKNFEIFVKIFNKKILGQKNFSFVKYLRLFEKKRKSSKRRFGKFTRNEDYSMPISRTRTFVFLRRPWYVAPERLR